MTCCWPRSLTEHPDLEVVGGFMTREYYGMVMREDDSKWRDWINFSIQAAWKNGTYLRLYHKYFYWRSRRSSWKSGKTSAADMTLDADSV